VDNGFTTPGIGCGRIVEIGRAKLIWRIKNQETGRSARPVSKCPPKMGGYFSEVLMLLKVPLSAVPTPFTAVMIAIAIPAAIKPYSMAVAPDSFLRNFKIMDFMAVSDLGWVI
jgi:hypothetical protein